MIEEREGDRHRNRPTRWRQRHELVLEMHLAGGRTTEIAERLGYSPHRVSCIVNSPLFEQKKSERIRELRGTDAGAYLEEIRRDAVSNFRFLVSQRDNESLPAHVRISAARQIQRALDRAMPGPST